MLDRSKICPKGLSLFNDFLLWAVMLDRSKVHRSKIDPKIRLSSFSDFVLLSCNSAVILDRSKIGPRGLALSSDFVLLS